MNEETVATAVRLEIDNDTDDVFVVFQITDEKLKQTIRLDWEKDLPLRIIGNRKLSLVK